MGIIADAIERFRAKEKGIDVSQWVEKDPNAKPEDPHPLAVYREWRNQHPFDRHPIDILHSLDILTSRHAGAGWFLIRLKASDLMRLDVSRMGEVLKDKGRSPDGLVLDGDWIYILDHRLTPAQREVVETVCWGIITQDWIDRKKNAIQDAFDALVNITGELLNGPLTD